jgi:hypothetical protein
LIGGDANLPDIDCKTTSKSSRNNPEQLNSILINTVFDISGEQVVDFPTRGHNTLDILITNRSTLINRCLPIPGQSDHDIILTDTNIVPSRQKPVKQLIHLWNKADTSKMATDLEKDLDEFTKTTTIDIPVNSLWTTFKTICLNIIKTYVPTTWTSTRFSQPWCNRSIKRLSRRKYRAYKRCRRSGKEKDRERYRLLQKSSQKEYKKAYNSYVSDMMQDDSKSKTLNSFMKSKKCDSVGIAPLRSDGNLHGGPQTKASLLNDQFSSVFTTEDSCDIPSLGRRTIPSAPNITITERGYSSS